MSDAFNDAGKLRQELADVWPMLRSAEADNTRLRAEIDRLREAVQYAVDNFDLPDGEYSGLEREAIRRLKAALAGTADQPDDELAFCRKMLEGEAATTRQLAADLERVSAERDRAYEDSSKVRRLYNKLRESVVDRISAAVAECTAPQPSPAPEIFGGDASRDLWRAINAVDHNTAMWEALYALGCACQNLESLVRRTADNGDPAR